MREKFQKELNKLLIATEKMGGCAIEIRADYLYSRVEGYICDSRKMFICANVLRENMQEELNKVIWYRPACKVN